MSNDNNHLMKSFIKGCSIGCGADIWHYYTNPEPSVNQLTSSGKVMIIPPTEYNGSTELCLLNLAFQGRIAPESIQKQRFTKLLTNLHEPIFIELSCSHQEIELQCATRKTDKILIQQSFANSYPELLLEQNTEHRFAETLSRLHNTKSHEYVFELISYVPNKPYFGMVFDNSENGFWSFQLQSLFMELDEGEHVLIQMGIAPCKYDWGTHSADIVRKAKILMRDNLWMPPKIRSLATKLCSVSEKEVLGQYFAITLRCALIVRSNKKQKLVKKLRQGLALLDRPFHTVDRNYLRKNNISNSAIRKAVTNRLCLFPGYPVHESELSFLLPFNNPGFSLGVLNNLFRNNNLSKNLEGHVQPKILGTTRLGDRDLYVSQSEEYFCRHTYVIAGTGGGKTCLFENSAYQDIKMGRGVCIIDPHGDFASRLLTLIPQNRIQDVVNLDMGDPEYAFKFNLLKLPVPIHENCNIVMDSFQSIFSEWSYRQLDIMRYCILALLDFKNATLRDVTRMLLDTDFRREVLYSVRDPEVREWIKGFARFGKDAANPISYKINQLTTMPMLSQVINQPINCLDIFNIMDQSKILIVRLPKGILGEEACRLLGSLIISLVRFAALKRVNIPENERREFALYIDEFPSFITSSITGLLEESRKYKIGVHLAHQSFVTSDLPRSLKGAIISNTLTKIVFRCGIKDADFLSAEFPDLRSENLMGLQKYRAYVRMGDQTALIKTLPPPVATEDYSKEIIERNRREFCYRRPEMSHQESIGDDEDIFLPDYDDI